MNYAIVDKDTGRSLAFSSNDRFTLQAGQKFHPAPDNFTPENAGDWALQDGSLIYTGLPTISHRRFLDLLGDDAIARMELLVKMQILPKGAPAIGNEHLGKLMMAYTKVIGVKMDVVLNPDPGGTVYPLLLLCANYHIINNEDVTRIMNNQTAEEAAANV